ncbi:MAG: hypothetical protein ACJ0CN_04755 [Candidatus Poseidoniaceae archaeon]
MEATYSKYGIFEWLAIFIVVFAATSLYFYSPEETQSEAQLASLSGTIELSTRDSMDSFGLQDFKTGAIANLNLTSFPVAVKDCGNCDAEITGVTLQGEITITELYDMEDRKGRVEGELNFTHLIYQSSKDYVDQERIIFNWNAGDVGSSWELILNHNPPRWLPSLSENSNFIETSLGIESRSGPELLIKTPEPGIKLIQACLPDSFLCKNTSPDAILIATFEESTPPIGIVAPTNWIEQDISNLSFSSQDLSLIDGIIETTSQVANNNSYALTNSGMIEQASTYQLTQNTSSLSPLSTWFSAVGLTTFEIKLHGSVVVKIQTESHDFYNILNTNGELVVGLVT